jgi:cobalt-precorrin 5A hydrolase
VRTLASVDAKRDQDGLLRAAAELGAPIRFLPAGEIRSSTRDFAATPAAERRLDIPAVAEPAALLAGRRTSFLLRKTIREGVTVAIAREGSTS